MTVDVEDRADMVRALRELAARTREFIDATVMTDVEPEIIAAVAADMAAMTHRLSALRRDTPSRIIHDAGSLLPERANSMVTGTFNPMSPPMRTVSFGDGELTATVTCGPRYMGPPGRMHGGMVATLLDHVLGMTVGAAGHRGVTASLTVDMRAVTPLNVPLELRGRFLKREGRKVFAEGEIRADGVVTASATAIFVVV